MNRSSLYLFLPVLFWGLSYIAIKVVLRELTPVEMISARFLLAAPVLLVIIRAKGLPIVPTSMRLKLILASGVVFLHFWVMAVGMRETSASNAAWILTTAPIFVALLSRAYLKERFRLMQWGGLLIACAGVFALVYNGNPVNLGWLHSRGDLIMLCSCVTWAFYTVGTREITAEVHPLVATFWMTAIAGLIFVPWTLLTSGPGVYWKAAPVTIAALVFLGVFCLAMAFWLWSEGLKRQRAAEVSLYLYFEPLVTVVGAWVL
ncbi:MAG: DMT family transporter, partial [candidate division Zixibacteria bacterium]|nr:DMT family transporter [candidate division Zixibacteria bacterium]